MPLPIGDAALVRFLSAKATLYHGKLLELREIVEQWLSYVPQTFPHYTRHTVLHSDEIIIQMSKFLFLENDPHRPVVGLSAIEAYILAAAAYLHDAGMVASDREKLQYCSLPNGTNGYPTISREPYDGKPSPSCAREARLLVRRMVTSSLTYKSDF